MKKSYLVLQDFQCNCPSWEVPGGGLPLWVICLVPLNPVLGETHILLVGVYDLVQN